MNRIVIDGFNLIYAAEPTRKAILGGDDPSQAMALLESKLAAYCSGRRGVRATVVYDGEPPQGGRHTYPGVNVRFAADADSEVVRLARRYASAGDHVRAVSSDRSGVRHPLTGVRNVEVVGAGTFWTGTIESSSGGADSGRDTGGKPPPPRGAELDYWKRQFGLDEE